MIYVEILGRMGNQMFSYAFARVLQHKIKKQSKEKIVFDYTNFEFGEDERNCLKNYICGVNISEGKRRCSLIQRAVLYLYFRERNLSNVRDERDIYRIESKWRDILNIFGIYLCSFNFYKFKFKPLTKNILLLGFFESYKFFEEFDDILRKEFKPESGKYNTEITEIINTICSTESVCIGIRRGDFESADNKNFCSVCGSSYYNRAIRYMIARIPKARFFIFTDDPKWVADSVSAPIDTVIIGDDLIKFDDKLYIMSLCKNFIISNSTYIWWAQHLSDAQNKIVIAPDKWRNATPDMHTGIYEKGWIIIETDEI